MEYRFKDAIKIDFGMDFFSEGFSKQELNDIYYRLCANPDQESLLFETATIDEIDTMFNYGESDFILEAVTVKKFSQTNKRMLALARALNRFMQDDGITVLEPEIGKPKKSGLFSTVTVQLPLSDGQVISIVFHSPDNDAKKITPDDTIIAFRWLLNKKDITQVVSPEENKEVSLDTISKRMGQLAVKNSEKFQSKQKQIKEQKVELETLQAAIETGKERSITLTAELAAKQDDSENLDLTIKNTEQQIEAQKNKNQDLRDQLARLQAQKVDKGIDALRKAVRDRQEIKKANARAEEVGRLQRLGAEAVPGIRLQDAETAGKIKEMLDRGEVTQEQWDKYVADLYSSGKAPRPEPESKTLLNDVITKVDDRVTALGFTREPPTNDSMVAGREFAWSMPSNAYVKINLDDQKITFGGLGFDKPASSKKFESISEILGKVDDAMKTFSSAEPEPTPEPELKPYLALYNSKRLEIWAKDLYDAKQKAIETLKVPKSKQGLLAVERAELEEGDKPPVTPEPTPEPEATEPNAVIMLNKILDGEYDDDPDTIDRILDEAVEELEGLDLMNEYDDLLNEAADHYTVVLEQMQEAA